MIPTPDTMPLFDREHNLDYVLRKMKMIAAVVPHRMSPEEHEVFGEGEYEDLDLEDFAENTESYVDLLLLLMNHGTRGYYNAGCHCEWCVAANRQYYRRNSGKARIKFVQSILEDAL